MEQSTEARQILRFGVFEVDIQERELRRSGLKVKIQEQPFQILALLLARPGAVVGREDLQKAVWPNGTFVDFERGLNTAVTKLREALGDEPENPRFIETLPRRGYRFIAAVNGGLLAGGIPTLAVAAARSRSPSWHRWIAVAFLSAIVIVVVVWALWRDPSRRTEMIERKLTSNSSENSVSSAAISPDGKYLAYADKTGVSLKVIRTGEIRSVPLPGNFSARVDAWFPDGSHLLLSREEASDKVSLWSMSIFGGSPRQLADDAGVGSVSPDGAHIAFSRGDWNWGPFGREVWVMRSDGTGLVKVAGDKGDSSDVGAPTWSPDGKRIAYIRTKWAYNDAQTNAVEINEWRSGHTEILFSDPALSPALHWLKDSRLIFALRPSQDQQGSTLWVVSLQQSGRLSSRPERITGAHGWISQVTGSADGKVVIFLRGDMMPSVYIAGLTVDGTHLLANRRLTLDENVNIPFSWTPDSKAVLFTSNRNGTQEIFKQAINQPSPESLVAGAEQLAQPRLTPDAKEVLYISTPKPSSPEALSSIFAIPIGGGIPRLVLKDTGIWNVQCARAPSTVCLYSVSRGRNTETFRFDVNRGKIGDPPQVDPICNWSLSPDGSQRAIVPFGPNPNTGKIQFRSTATGKARDVVVKGWSGLQSIDWFPDGKSLLVGWNKFERDSALLKIKLDGRATVLLRSSNPEIGHAIPSPDGRLLAIAEAGGTKNVWQIENF